MELQEIFDKVSNHLLTQNRKSITAIHGKSEDCAYRGNNGASCAIGCLIPDAAYHPDMEGKNINDDKVWGAIYPVIGSSIGRNRGCKKLNLLSDLQVIHDEELPEEWTKALQNLANERGLIFTPPTKGSNHGTP